MDWRFFGGGAAMMAVGIVTALLFGMFSQTGPLEDIERNRGIAQMGGIVGAIGFLLLLVSFGFSRRKKSGGPGKGLSTKPDEPKSS